MAQVGQYLASRNEAIPEEYIFKFTTLQDSVPSKPFKEIQTTLKQEYGTHKLSSIFSDIDPVPLASASIAQVHRAKLRHGKQSSVKWDVVIKVQHVNARECVTRDLKDLSILMLFVNLVQPDFDMTGIIKEWSDAVPKELDFVLECQNLIKIKTAIQKHNAGLPTESPLYLHVDAPEPLTHLVTEKCLVMEYIDGYKIMDMDSSIDKHSILESIVKVTGFQMLTLGFWNSGKTQGWLMV
jgi:aarF domain-containing kinase